MVGANFYFIRTRYGFKARNDARDFLDSARKISRLSVGSSCSRRPCGCAHREPATHSPALPPPQAALGSFPSILNALRYEKFLALWKAFNSHPRNLRIGSPFGRAPAKRVRGLLITLPHPVIESIPKRKKPTVRAVARRSIISYDSEGIEIAQTRLRPSPKRKSSVAPKSHPTNAVTETNPKRLPRPSAR